jgi:hypothetical protein
MQRFVLTIAFVVVNLAAVSQTYSEMVQQAEHAYSRGLNDSCSFFFSRAFLIKTPSANDLYNAAICSKKNGSVKDCFELLHESIRAGVNISKLKIDPEWEDLYEKKTWKKLMRYARKQQAAALSKTQYPAEARQLSKIWETDQYYRFRLGKAYEQNDTALIASLWKVMRRADSLNGNVAKLEVIIDRIGWPTISRVGKYGAGTAFLVMDHSPVDIMEKYLPFLEQAARAGEASLADFATMKDRVLVNRGKKQLYGTQKYRDQLGKAVFFPIEDETNVNKRRKEMNLEPLSEFVH